MPGEVCSAAGANADYIWLIEQPQPVNFPNPALQGWASSIEQQAVEALTSLHQSEGRIRWAENPNPESLTEVENAGLQVHEGVRAIRGIRTAENVPAQMAMKPLRSNC